MRVPSIVVTLSNRCEVQITKQDELIMIQRNPDGFIAGVIDLGPATKTCIEQVQDSFGRLYTHARQKEASG